MSLPHEQIESIIDQAIHQQKFFVDPVFGGVPEYEQAIDDAIDDLESKLPSALKVDSTGYTVNGTTIHLDANLGGRGSYDITTARVGAAEYHGVEFDVEEVVLIGTIELSDDPTENDHVEVISSDISYKIYGDADPY